MNPKDLKYTKEQTWVRVEGGEATIGITDYAQAQLGSVLFVEVKDIGDKVAQFKSCGTIESDKATSDIISPVSGEVVAVNEDMLNAPEKVNEDPYGGGWMLRVQLADPGELNKLMAIGEFESYLASLETREK